MKSSADIYKCVFKCYLQCDHHNVTLKKFFYCLHFVWSPSFSIEMNTERNIKLLCSFLFGFSLDFSGTDYVFTCWASVFPQFSVLVQFLT